MAALLANRTWGSLKLCRPLMVETITVNRMIGRMIGMVIWKNVRMGPAPSILAAS